MRLFGMSLFEHAEKTAQEHQRRLREETLRNQAAAADPGVSAWVSANAGTGKTHVLTNRVLRLLLAGTAPERILALTYTKAAAAEMSTRVFQRLAHWATASPGDLTGTLSELIGRAPAADELQEARRLFARAIETPGGLKVQTIHAFCERLLQRFPLEAGVSPGFVILDEQQSSALVSEAVDDLLAAAAADKSGPLWAALEAAIAYAVDDRFEKLLAEAFRLCGDADGIDLEDEERRLRDACGVRRSVSLDGLAEELAGTLSEEVMPALADALRIGTATDQERAEILAKAIGAPSIAARIGALETFFLTDKKERRARLVTKAVAAASPGIAETLADAQTRFVELYQEYTGLTVVDATLALVRLGRDALGRYRAAKARLAALDFDDLVAQAAALLRSSAAVEWVLYKLDGGLDHILVDEAQDTSPVQWQVIRSLAAEFFSGEGAREEPRTLFAVGDEKQSIYSFQGAAPTMFAETGDAFKASARQSNRPWEHIPLTLSFRTVEPLLAAVDRVFASAGRTPGIGGPGKAKLSHIAHRYGQAGLVEIWATEKAAAADAAEPWAPLAEASVVSPVKRLAARIAETIKGWLEAGERLESEDRNIEAGDILILVRKRMPFAPAMVSALKARGIPVAGADRLVLTEQIAVQDLVALGDALLLPEDDLAVASVLKSPLFGMTDDDLIALAPARAGSLWEALMERAGSEEAWRPAARQLRLWQAEAQQVAPFEFYAAVLDRDGMRARMLARLGSEAADPLDAFLDQALAHDKDGPPSLQGFLATLRDKSPQIKRDMEQGRNEVRVMTVHGAKGLEAPIVFLPDTCSTRSGSPPGSLLKTTDAVRFLWPVRGTGRVRAIENARQEQQQAEREERDRLLYVALTRARDRLYVAGFEGAQAPPSDCWYNLVREGLAECLTQATDRTGRPVWRLQSRQTAPHETARAHAKAEAAAVSLPPWIDRPAAPEPGPGIRLRPSRLAPLEADDSVAPRAPPVRAEPALASPRMLLEDYRFLRGTLTHALLEHLPGVAPRHRQAAAEAFLASRAPKLAREVQADIVAETLAVLRHPDFAALFGPDSRAEVPIVALLPRPGGGPPLSLTGKIDRLVETHDGVMIVDYKTNRPPPHDVKEVAEAYLLQLAAYRLAVADIFPGVAVRAALLWTDGPRIMEIPRVVLDEHATRLWTLDPARLDA